MCCPVLRLDESFATLLALDAFSGQRLWAAGMGGGGILSECANLYVDSDTLIQIGRGRIDGSDHYSVRFHNPINGQQIALLKFSNSATARGIEPKKTSNYFWVNTGTGRVIDASDYSIYGTSTIYEGIISGQDKLYGVGSANYFTSDKDGATTTSSITGVRLRIQLHSLNHRGTLQFAIATVVAICLGLFPILASCCPVHQPSQSFFTRQLANMLQRLMRLNLTLFRFGILKTWQAVQCGLQRNHKLMGQFFLNHHLTDCRYTYLTQTNAKSTK